MWQIKNCWRRCGILPPEWGIGEADPFQHELQTEGSGLD